MRALLLLAALVGCGSHPPAGSGTHSTSAPAGSASGSAVGSAAPAPAGLGKHGDVCSYGERHPQGERLPAPAECGPGLQCCYPCGIQGCDSVCHTPDECNTDRMRP